MRNVYWRGSTRSRLCMAFALVTMMLVLGGCQPMPMGLSQQLISTGASLYSAPPVYNHSYQMGAAMPVHCTTSGTLTTCF